MNLEVTIVEGETRKPVSNYSLKKDILEIPELAKILVLTPEAKTNLGRGRTIVYTDSVFPLNNPKEMIVGRYIEVRYRPAVRK
jgi:hypothetical protein